MTPRRHHRDPITRVASPIAVAVLLAQLARATIRATTRLISTTAHRLRHHH